MPGTSASVSAFIMWHVEVPMTMSIWPGPVTWAAGAVTCASTLAAATAMPSGSPVHAAALRRQRARAGAERGEGRPLELVGDEPGEALVERRAGTSADGYPSWKMPL